MNEIYSPIFEKKKVFSANERLVFQLVDGIRLNDKGTINYFKTSTKTHTKMGEKIAIPLYAEHLHFLLTRCGWKVTKIRGHYTNSHLFQAANFATSTGCSLEKTCFG